VRLADLANSSDATPEQEREQTQIIRFLNLLVIDNLAIASAQSNYRGPLAEKARLIHVGSEARKAPIDAVVFFLDFHSYRSSQELAFRVCDHQGFAE
jgi:hypothetical protein